MNAGGFVLAAVAAGALFLANKMSKITTDKGVRRISAGERDRILPLLQRTTLEPANLPGQFAMSLTFGGVGPDTMKMISGIREKGMAVYASDSILDLSAKKGPTEVHVVLVFDELSAGAAIAGPGTHFAQLIP